MGFPGGSYGKESACNVGDPGSIPGSGRSLGEGHGNPLQYSCLENPMDGGAWWAPIHGVEKSQDTTELLTHSSVRCQRRHLVVLTATATATLLQSCLTLRPQRRQPTRLPRPWDSPGKNTGVGCHFLFQCIRDFHKDTSTWSPESNAACWQRECWKFLKYPTRE